MAEATIRRGTSKRWREQREKVNREQPYHPLAAMQLVKELGTDKYDEAVEAHFKLGLDVRKADQMLRSTITLPHGVGKTSSVLVFAQGEKVAEAEAAGADFVGGDELAKKIEGGWFDFDVVIATPDMMATVGRLGRVLGPRGKMPNPKTGTVTFDVGQAVEATKGGKF
jgi:large subunit ribosomal protein L1